MKRLSVTILVAMLALTAVASAQMQAPKPGPEHQKLQYFAGTWSMDGDMKPSPMGPGGKFTGTEHNEWMDGGFFLLSHSDVTMPVGKAKGLAVFGYNSEEKMYTYNGFNSMGEGESAKGTIDGDTWNWTNENKMGGKLMRGRYTVKTLSPTSYTFKFEMQPEGADWATIMEGKATKVK
jgi:hypothetical protein